MFFTFFLGLRKVFFKKKEMFSSFVRGRIIDYLLCLTGYTRYGRMSFKRKKIVSSMFRV